jgi:hypothetical protein
MASDPLLLSAVLEGLKRSRNQWGLHVPEPLRPIALAGRELPGPHSNETFAHYQLRRRMFSALAASPIKKAPDAVMRQLVSSDAWSEFVQERAAGCECRYCKAGEVAARSLEATSFAVETRKIRRHADFDIDFDPNTYITKVSIRSFCVEMPESWAAQLARKAHPQHWHDAAPDFFLKSNPAELRNTGWYEMPEWQDPRGGDLYEVTSWSWNESMRGEVHNILNIRDLEQTDAGISYKYALRQCLKSNMGFVWEEGGLDVDDGSYELLIHSELTDGKGSRQSRVRQRAPKHRAVQTKSDGDEATSQYPSHLMPENEGNVVVEISAEKSVRYTTPRIAPAEIGTTLNLMAPALVSMLLRRLVLDAGDPSMNIEVVDHQASSPPPYESEGYVSAAS